MYAYMIGQVTKEERGYIVLEVNQIGYQINVANPYSYPLNGTVKVYLYQQIKEDEHSLYGFLKEEERDLFLRLIEVKGVGCKMALPILATGSIAGIIDAIERENILYLKKFPKIGDKVAKQIVLDLKGKLVTKESVLPLDHEELGEALKALGYKTADISKILVKIPNNLTIEEEIKEALKLLLK